ncbi:MAG: gliding motility-associated C-terminal domain-containing protein, partial [Opitutaceae bacterium]|nr:gliding motility-associated C-terminal domain-containing protein [Cytophagales bacterium]
VVKDVSYNWTEGANTSTDSTFGKTISSNTTISLTATSKPGCYLSGDSLKETQTVTISVAEPVEINLIYDEAGNCKNAPLFLNTSEKGNIKSYKWYINDSIQTEKNSSSEFFTDLNFHDVVKVEAVPFVTCDASILNTDTARINVYDKPAIGFTNGETIVNKCAAEPITLISNETNDNYKYTWSKNGTALTELNNSLIVVEEGKYQLKIENNSCSIKSEIEVRNNLVNVKILTDHAEFVPGEVLDAEAVIFSGNSNGISYSWSPANIVLSGNAVKIQVIPLETILLKIDVKTPEGCKGKDSLLLKKKDKLFIPNAIIPDGNEINAYWGIKGTENYPDLDIKVFNRWGTLVHEQKGYSTQWDGTIKGKALPAGTYYYVIKDPKSNEPFVGDLTIVR